MAPRLQLNVCDTSFGIEDDTISSSFIHVDQLVMGSAFSDYNSIDHEHQPSTKDRLDYESFAGTNNNAPGTVINNAPPVRSTASETELADERLDPMAFLFPVEPDFPDLQPYTPVDHIGNMSFGRFQKHCAANYQSRKFGRLGAIEYTDMRSHADSLHGEASLPVYV